MKKYLTGLIAIILAVSAFALPRLSSKNLDLYWYLRIHPNTYVSDGYGTDPNHNCSGYPKICTKGFVSRQTESLITDATLADQVRTQEP